MCFSGCRSPLSVSRKSILSLSCWNVHGLTDRLRFGNKLTNEEFINHINKHDIVILTESWMKDDVQIPGFNTFSNAAQKTYKKKTGRLSGGLVLGYKNYLRSGISFVKSHNNYIWCKLNHTFFNLEQDVYLCALYIPPHDSPYFDPDLFSNIETDIALFHRKGLIVLAGDFNARTGKENDFITDESGKFIPGGDIPPPPNLTKRQNFDNIVNDHGKQLLDLCKTCDLRILNGRSKGDTLGKFTFHSINGISTVDYIIVSHDLFTSVQGFAVKQPNIFSDHSQIVCWIKTGTDLSNNNNSFQERNNVKLPQQYVWDETSAAKFTAALSFQRYSVSITSLRKYKLRFKQYRC